jgi:uncharacterized phage protein (TIGR01671 family)
MEYKFKFVLENDKGEKVITESYTLDIIMFCDMLDRIHEDLNEKYGCDGNCTNESNSFCECGGIFDDYEITDKLMWTGLKDKNEVDIYCGDIVSHLNPTCKGDVKLGEYECGEFDTYVYGTGFYINRELDYCGHEHYEPLTIDMGIEVIGNTTDNPELLKE